MVDYNLLDELDITDEMVEHELAEAFGQRTTEEHLENQIESDLDELTPGTILTGRIVGRAGDDVVVDVGLKSEGIVPADEWTDSNEIQIGNKIQVWLDAVETDTGLVQISKRRADRHLNWQHLIETANEGDVVKGTVMRKIKGGLLVDIGVPVFLPASQVDIRRPGDIAEFIGQEVEAVILKIDTDRRNIVVSRRKLIEEKRQAARDNILQNLEVGQTVKGVVKNIADFGAFVDLGGIDGLLHITDLSWERVHHPSSVLKLDQEIEVTVLSIDQEKEKIALGLKQQHENPWERIDEKYPVNSKIKGEVVNITNYGAFIKLEPGVEGLVHISEMSWTRRINHPSEMVGVGDEVEVMVLDIDKGKQEISLGMKQTETNPWTTVAAKYPPNTRITGRVRNLTNYGAFIEIEEGIDGLLHVSDLSWTKKISHPSELLKKDEEIECVVLSVEEDKQRIALGLKQLTEDPWERAVPENYIPGQIVEGTVTKITNFGVFVELEEDLEGLLHVSELSDERVDDAHDTVKVGEKIQVKILRVDPIERKIGLSKKRAEWASEPEDERMDKKERRGGLVGPGDMGTDLIDRNLLHRPKPEQLATPAESSTGDASDEQEPTSQEATSSAQESTSSHTPEADLETAATEDSDEEEGTHS